MTDPKIPKRMMPFTGLCALAVLSLILSGCGSKPQTADTNTQQKTSSSTSTRYDSADVAMTSGEAAPTSEEGQYDSSGSKVTFDPPSYRSGYGYTSSTSSAAASVSQTSDGTVYVPVDNSTMNLLRSGKSSTIAFVTATPVFHGVNNSMYRCPNPGIYTPSSCGNTVDPVFHGAHW